MRRISERWEYWIMFSGDAIYHTREARREEYDVGLPAVQRVNTALAVQ